MNEQTIRFRVGLFVLAALILLAVLITLFGGLPNYFRKAASFTLEFDNAQGLAVGTPIKKAGVKIGEVRSIRLDDATGKVLVGIDIDDSYKLKKSDQPTLMTSILGGDAVIALLPKDKKAPADDAPVPPGTMVPGRTPADAGTLLQKTGDLMPPAQEALVEIKKVFERLDKEALTDIKNTFRRLEKMAPIIEETMLEYRTLAKNANALMPDLKKASEELTMTARTFGKVGERTDVFLQANQEKLTKAIGKTEETLTRVAELFNEDNQKSIRDILKNTKAASDRFDSIARNTESATKQLAGTIQKADDVFSNIGEFTKPLAGKGAVLAKNLEDSLTNFSRTMTDVRELIGAVGRSEGTFAKFITDPALYNNLNDAALSAVRIMPRLDRAMRDFEIFADKIARHPESLGIGGVVRPGTGIKESFYTIPR